MKLSSASASDTRQEVCGIVKISATSVSSPGTYPESNIAKAGRPWKETF